MLLLIATFVSVSSYVCHSSPLFLFFFFFNDTATTEIYTLSLHDALPIQMRVPAGSPIIRPNTRSLHAAPPHPRSEEHTSELQSLRHLVCRLLLEKKKKYNRNRQDNKQTYEPQQNLHTQHEIELDPASSLQ